MNHPIDHRSRQVILYVAVGYRNSPELVTVVHAPSRVWSDTKCLAWPRSGRLPTVVPFQHGCTVFFFLITAWSRIRYQPLGSPVSFLENYVSFAMKGAWRAYSLYWLCLSGWTIRVSNPSGGKHFFLLAICQTGCGAHSSPYSIGIRGFPGVKMASAWSDHSPPPRACMHSWRGKGQIWLLFVANKRGGEVQMQATGCNRLHRTPLVRGSLGRKRFTL
jgi:hypothetical protein